MSEVAKIKTNLPATEAENIANAASEDAGFEKMMKFKKGDYWLDNREVPHGTTYIAHAIGWTKTWVHFENGMVVDRKIYRVARGEKPVERDRLDCLDETTWPFGLDGKRRMDPWVYQYLLPMEDPKTNEVCLFVTGSFGGRRAVADVCTAWGRRNVKNPGCGQPIVKLGKAMMPTKHYGDVPRPNFEIVGWDEMQRVVKDVDVKELSKDQFDDAIPF